MVSDHADPRDEYIPDPHGPRYAGGGVVPALLDTRVARLGVAGARLPSRSRETAGREAGCLPRYGGTNRPGRRVLRAPRRVAVVRPQRGVRAALRIPRVEVRRERPVRGPALRTGRERHAPEHQAQVLP